MNSSARLALFLGLQLAAGAAFIACGSDGGDAKTDGTAGGTTNTGTTTTGATAADTGGWADAATFDAIIVRLITAHSRRWSADYVEHPDKLARHVVELLVDLRLAERAGTRLRLLPAAARFVVVEPDQREVAEPAAALW